MSSKTKCVQTKLDNIFNILCLENIPNNNENNKTKEQIDDDKTKEQIDNDNLWEKYYNEYINSDFYIKKGTKWSDVE